MASFTRLFISKSKVEGGELCLGWEDDLLYDKVVLIDGLGSTDEDLVWVEWADSIPFVTKYKSTN